MPGRRTVRQSERCFITEPGHLRVTRGLDGTQGTAPLPPGRF